MKIVVGGRFDYVEMLWRKAVKENGVIYFENGVFRKYTLRNRLRRKLWFLLHKSGLVSDKKYKETVKIDNYRELFDIDSLKRNEEIIFLIYEMNVLSTDFDMIKLLRRRYPKAKFVLYFTNIIGSVRNECSQAILKNRELYDIIYAYCIEDAKKYNFNYLFFEPYEKIECKEDEKYSSDVLWIGRNKGRYEEILQINAELKKAGLNSKFIMVDDTLPAGKEPIEIIGKGLSYEEYLKYAANTKCLLDIEMNGAITTRFFEAIAYGKLYLTNNPEKIKSDIFRDTDQMIYFEKTSDLEGLDLSKYGKKPVDPELVSVNNFIKQIMSDLDRKPCKKN